MENKTSDQLAAEEYTKSKWLHVPYDNMTHLRPEYKSFLAGLAHRDERIKQLETENADFRAALETYALTYKAFPEFGSVARTTLAKHTKKEGG